MILSHCNPLHRQVSFKEYSEIKAFRFIAGFSGTTRRKVQGAVARRRQ
jgi:hypothetical protein